MGTAEVRTPLRRLVSSWVPIASFHLRQRPRTERGLSLHRSSSLHCPHSTAGLARPGSSRSSPTRTAATWVVSSDDRTVSPPGQSRSRFFQASACHIVIAGPGVLLPRSRCDLRTRVILSAGSARSPHRRDKRWLRARTGRSTCHLPRSGVALATMLPGSEHVCPPFQSYHAPPPNSRTLTSQVVRQH
jgi:hypothetical protein